MKKIICAIMALMLTLSIVCACSFAQGTAVEVSTEEELRQAVECDDFNVVLNADIKLEQELYINYAGAIDCNGHVISGGYMVATKDLIIKNAASVNNGEDFCYISLDNKDGTLTVDGGSYSYIFTCGDAVLSNCSVISLDVSSQDEDLANITINNANIKEYDLLPCIINIDVSKELKTGRKCTDNGDGTYTVSYYKVEPIGRKYKLTFDNNIGDNEVYFEKAESIKLSICYVDNGEHITVSMREVKGKPGVWETEFDAAYAGASFHIENPSQGEASFIMTLPDGDCAVKYVNGNMDVVIQSNFTFIYVIVAFVVIVSCAVIVLLAIKRKKAAALK